MDRRWQIGILGALLAACGGASSPATQTPSAAAIAGLHVGDYVVYRYAGRVVGPEPMHLMQEVVALDGDRLVVEVTLTRGHDTVRAWRQTVAAPAGPIEALCRIDGETCLPVDDPDGAGRRAMYEGLVVDPDAAPTDPVDADETVEVGGVEMTCHVHRASITHGGEAMSTKDIVCPDFPWANGGAAVEYPDKRRVLRVTVESFGSAG
jgi:hypothetical protein